MWEWLSTYKNDLQDFAKQAHEIVAGKGSTGSSAHEYSWEFDRSVYLNSLSGEELEHYDVWASGFQFESYASEIAAVLEANPKFQDFQNSLVPSQVKFHEFWKRYFFLRQRKESLRLAAAELQKREPTDSPWDEDDSKRVENATDVERVPYEPPVCAAGEEVSDLKELRLRITDLAEENSSLQQTLHLLNHDRLKAKENFEVSKKILLESFESEKESWQKRFDALVIQQERLAELHASESEAMDVVLKQRETELETVLTKLARKDMELDQLVHVQQQFADMQAQLVACKEALKRSLEREDKLFESSRTTVHIEMVDWCGETEFDNDRRDVENNKERVQELEQKVAALEKSLELACQTQSAHVTSASEGVSGDVAVTRDSSVPCGLSDTENGSTLEETDAVIAQEHLGCPEGTVLETGGSESTTPDVPPASVSVENCGDSLKEGNHASVRGSGGSESATQDVPPASVSVENCGDTSVSSTAVSVPVENCGDTSSAEGSGGSESATPDVPPTSASVDNCGDSVHECDHAGVSSTAGISVEVYLEDVPSVMTPENAPCTTNGSEEVEEKLAIDVAPGEAFCVDPPSHTDENQKTVPEDLLASSPNDTCSDGTSCREESVEVIGAVPTPIKSEVTDPELLASPAESSQSPPQPVNAGVSPHGDPAHLDSSEVSPTQGGLPLGEDDNVCAHVMDDGPADAEGSLREGNDADAALGDTALDAPIEGDAGALHAVSPSSVNKSATPLDDGPGDEEHLPAVPEEARAVDLCDDSADAQEGTFEVEPIHHDVTACQLVEPDIPETASGHTAGSETSNMRTEGNTLGDETGSQSPPRGDEEDPSGWDMIQEGYPSGANPPGPPVDTESGSWSD